jgi:hypothetical protein
MISVIREEFVPDAREFLPFCKATPPPDPLR